MTRIPYNEYRRTKRNKYKAERCYSELCQRRFDSKLERERGEQLRLMEMTGDIIGLQFQSTFRLCDIPKVTITIDFTYTMNGIDLYEDAKGVLTRDTRTKLAWLKEKYGIDVILYRG